MRGLIGLAGLLCAAAVSFGQTAREVSFSDRGYTTYGEWIAEASASPNVGAARTAMATSGSATSNINTDVMASKSKRAVPRVRVGLLARW